MQAERIILDTDIGADVSDLATLSMYLNAAKAGRIQALGILINTANEQALPTAHILQHYLGTDLPIGAAPQDGFCNYAMHWKYTRYLLEAYKSPVERPEAKPYTDLYRQLLASQPDKSVCIVLTGPMRGLKALLNTPPDAYSELDGRTLVARKVSRLVASLGYFSENEPIEKDLQSRSGWDVWRFTQVPSYIDWDVSAARYVNDKWPTRMDWVGAEVGNALLTGQRFCEAAPADHPLKLAYHHFTRSQNHTSGNQLALYLAAQAGESEEFFSQPGKVLMDGQGRTMQQVYAGGRDRYIRNGIVSAHMAREIESVVLGR